MSSSGGLSDEDLRLLREHGKSESSSQGFDGPLSNDDVAVLDRERKDHEDRRQDGPGLIGDLIASHSSNSPGEALIALYQHAGGRQRTTLTYPGTTSAPRVG